MFSDVGFVSVPFGCYDVFEVELVFEFLEE